MARLALALVLVWLAAPSAARADTLIQPATAFQVDGGSVTTPALEAGQRYRLIAFGTFQEVGPNITYDFDSVYCFGDDATIAQCRDEPFQTNNSLWAEYEGSDGAPFHQLSGAVPTYDASHRYEIAFTAAQGVPLRLYAHLTELDRDYPGQLGVALYRVDGPAPCSRSHSTRQAGCGPTMGWSPNDPPPFGSPVSYVPPANGEAIRVKGPVIPKQAESTTVIVKSKSAEEIVAADIKTEVARNALTLCVLSSGAVAMSTRTMRTVESQIGQCVLAVLRVLQRCEELKARGGPGICGGPKVRQATASKNGGCGSRVLVLKRRRNSPRPPLRVKCKSTPAGRAVTFSEKPGGPNLRRALGKRPRLVFGMPTGAAAVQPGDRISVTWISG